MPAQVAAVLEDLAADTTLVHAPVLTQLTHHLPPDAVPAREDQAPLEGDGATLVMREPAGQMHRLVRQEGGRVAGEKISRLQSSWKERRSNLPSSTPEGGVGLRCPPALGLLDKGDTLNVQWHHSSFFHTSHSSPSALTLVTRSLELSECVGQSDPISSAFVTCLYPVSYLP